MSGESGPEQAGEEPTGTPAEGSPAAEVPGVASAAEAPPGGEAAPPPPTAPGAPGGAAPAPAGGEEEPWGRNLLGWVGQHPLLTLLLLAVTLAGPWLARALQLHLQAQRTQLALAEWQGRLEAVGLPIPGQPRVRVEAPPELGPVSSEQLERVGLAEWGLALLAWQRLLEGGPAGDLPRTGPLAPSLAACAALQRIAAGEAGAADELQRALTRVPAGVREPLELCGRLLLGQRARDVLSEVERLAAGSPPPAPPAAGTLAALLARAQAARWSEILAARPASVEDLRELLHAARTEPEALRAALAEAGPLGGWLAPGPGGLARLATLLDALDALQPPEAGPAQPLEPALLADAERVVGEALYSGREGREAALAQLLRLTRRDARADVPLECYGGWRDELIGVVNDRAALAGLALRVLESGRLPGALEELLPGLDEVLRQRGERTPGALLAALVAASGRAGAAPAAEDLEQARRFLSALEGALGARRDPVAQRLRSQARCVLAALSWRGGQVEAARALLEEALATGCQPRFRALALRAWLDLPAHPAEALAAQEQAEADLLAAAEGLPESQDQLAPARALELELTGRPTERRALERWLVELRVVRGEALLASGRAAEAAAACAEALRLRPGEAPPAARWLQARCLEAQGDPAGALAAANELLRASPDPALAAQVRAFLERLKAR